MHAGVSSTQHAVESLDRSLGHVSDNTMQASSISCNGVTQR